MQHCNEALDLQCIRQHIFPSDKNTFGLVEQRSIQIGQKKRLQQEERISTPQNLGGRGLTKCCRKDVVF